MNTARIIVAIRALIAKLIRSPHMHAEEGTAHIHVLGMGRTVDAASIVAHRPAQCLQATAPSRPQAENPPQTLPRLRTT